MTNPLEKDTTDNKQTPSKGGKILVLDDEVNIQMLLRSILQSEGYEVIATDDGYEALEMILSERDIDLVLVNIVMPIMNGVEFLKRLQELPEERKPIPIVLTGRPTTPLEEGYHDLGVLSLIRKPFKVKHLLTTIRGAIASRIKK